MTTHLSELFQILEFDKILTHIKTYAISNMAKSQIEHTELMLEKRQIQTALNEVAELRSLLDTDSAFPLQQIWDIRDSLEMASVAGHYLNCEALVQIAQNMITCRKVKSFIQNRKESCPNLKRHIDNIILLKDVEKMIAEKIDFELRLVKDSASANLNKIRKNIARAEQNVRRTVDKLFRSYSQQGILQEDIITLKDGRLVLPVKWENKGKVQGLVHDQSASGATLFIEPYAAVEINNEIRRLRGEESQEVERILRDLTVLVSANLEAVIQNLSVLVTFDGIQARAKFSQKLNCVQPALNEQNTLEISKGKHPLLLLRNENDKTVQPLDMKIPANIHTLVITGPNAGGKTVALKTVGLFSLMVQSGIPIPADADTQMPIFRAIFADIGDFQSIEQDLSTFSSRMKKMQDILEYADSRSLVLVDEIGVGTDPEEGSALAIAFLEELTRRGCLCIVTTHQSALKEFAFNTDRVENGSMEFETGSLQPTYKFKMGIPGSSYALEIASRLGISQKLLHRSKELIGAEKNSLERLILDLEKKMQETNKLSQELQIEKTRLQGLNNLYSDKLKKIKSQEKSLKERALSDAGEILSQANAAVEKAIKEIREKQAQKQAIASAHQIIADQKNKLQRAQKAIKEDKTELSPAVNLAIGEEVYWKKVKAYGTIVSKVDQADKVTIQIDNLKFKVPKNELFAGGKKSRTRSQSASIKINTSLKSDVLPEIDVRGQTLDEALATTDKFLDDALLAGWKQVRIIHGKGTGVLRKGLDEYLNQHPRVKNKKMGDWNAGDLGVTVVDLE
ncbi:MAG: endonuclease MutS2 [bacterium]